LKAIETRYTVIAHLSLFVAIGTIGTAGCSDAAPAEDADDHLGVEESRLVGGNVLADASRAPFAVHISIFRVDGTYQCSGIAIGPQLVLTAAHCLDGDNANIVVDRPQPAGALPYLGFARGEAWRVHPRYRPGSEPLYDIAVIKTTVPTVPWISARLAPNLPEVTDKLVEYGFGDTATGANDAGTLKKRSIVVKESGGLAFSTSGAGCPGDSGGPAIYRKQGKAFVAGIASRANCATFTQFASVAAYEPFIRRVMISL